MIRQPYLDLDRTLFDSERFLAAFNQVVDRVFGRDAAFQAERAHRATLALYNPLDHLVESRNILAQTVAQEVTAALKGQSFAFPDVAEFLDRLNQAGWDTPQIVTVGGPAMQAIKLACAPELQALAAAAVVLDYNKGVWIAARLTKLEAAHPGQIQAMCVDDKGETMDHLNPEAFPGLVNYVLDRPGARHQAADHPYAKRVPSLLDIPV